MVSNEQQNMDMGYKAEFRLIRTDYRWYSSLNKSEETVRKRQIVIPKSYNLKV